MIDIILILLVLSLSVSIIMKNTVYYIIIVSALFTIIVLFKYILHQVSIYNWHGKL